MMVECYGGRRRGRWQQINALQGTRPNRARPGVGLAGGVTLTAHFVVTLGQCNDEMKLQGIIGAPMR